MNKNSGMNRNTPPALLSLKGNRFHAFAFLILALTILFAWSKVLQFQTVNWDDTEYVLLNPFFQNPQDIISSYYMGNYHPVTLYSLYLDHFLWADHYSLWHATQLALHLACAFFLYLVTYRLSHSGFIALLTALTWALLPVHAEPVSWLSSRKDVLYTGFSLLSLWSVLHFVEAGNRKLKWYALSLLFFMLACFSKGMAVILPLWILLIVWGYFPDFIKRKNIVFLLPMILISLIFGVISIQAQQAQKAIQTMTHSWGQWDIALNSLGLLFKNTLVPQGLSPFYPYPDSVISLNLFLGASLVLAAILLSISRQKYLRRTGISLALFIVAALPVLQILPVGIALSADRYAYLASAGLLCGLIPALMSYLPIATQFRGVLLFIFPLIYFPLLVKQLPVWKNGVSVFTRVTSLFPEVDFAWSNLGNAHMMEKNFPAAEAAYQRAVSVNPQYGSAWANLTGLYRNQGNLAEAREIAKQGLSHNPDNHALSLHLYFLKSIEEINPDMLKAALSEVQNFPADPESWFMMGTLFQNVHQHENALICYDVALRLKPDYPAVRINQAISLSETRQFQKAIQSYQQLLKEEASPGIVWANLAWAYYKSGAYPEALKNAEESLRYLPHVPQLWFNYGLMALHMQQDSIALSAYQKAFELNPDSSMILQAHKDLLENISPPQEIKVLFPPIDK